MPRRDDEFEDDDRPRRQRSDDSEPVRKRKKGGRLGLILGILGVVALLCCGGGGFLIWYLADQLGLDSRDRRTSNNNLMQIGLAVHNYHDSTGVLPNNSYGPDGKPLLSWRVHILPYIGEDNLYRQFNLNEPWDGPNNRRLIAQMPRLYSTPDTTVRAGSGKTFYRGFSHPGAVFERPMRPGNQLMLTSLTDGTANTILVVEAGESVEWTRPDDLDFGPTRPLPPLGAGRAGDEVLVLMVNGSPRRIRKTLPETTWRALTTYNGGEVVPIP